MPVVISQCRRYPLMRPQCLRETKVCEVSTRRRTVVDIGVQPHTLTFHTHTYTHTHTRATYMVPMLAIHKLSNILLAISKAANRLVGLSSSSTSVLESLQKSLRKKKKLTPDCHGKFCVYKHRKKLRNLFLTARKI